MLNKIIEKKQIKCHPYWPKDGHKLELLDVGLTVEFLTSENYKNFSKRLFRITDMESTKSREVIQFHYTQVRHESFNRNYVTSETVLFVVARLWRSKLADCVFAVLEASPWRWRSRRERRPSHHSLQVGSITTDWWLTSDNLIFHLFSAGIGRSGTFCLVDCCLVLIDKDGENRVSVQEVLLELRKYRMGLIQTHDQLTFSYEAIIEGMKRMNNDVSFPARDFPGIACDDSNFFFSRLDIQRVGQLGNSDGKRPRRGERTAAAAAPNHVLPARWTTAAHVAARFQPPTRHLRAQRPDFVWRFGHPRRFVQLLWQRVRWRRRGREDTAERTERVRCKLKLTTGSQWNSRLNDSVGQTALQLGRREVSDHASGKVVAHLTVAVFLFPPSQNAKNERQ